MAMEIGIGSWRLGFCPIQPPQAGEMECQILEIQ